MEEEKDEEFRNDLLETLITDNEDYKKIKSKSKKIDKIINAYFEFLYAISSCNHNSQESIEDFYTAYIKHLLWYMNNYDIVDCIRPIDDIAKIAIGHFTANCGLESIVYKYPQALSLVSVLSKELTLECLGDLKNNSKIEPIIINGNKNDIDSTMKIIKQKILDSICDKGQALDEVLKDLNLNIEKDKPDE